MKRKLIDSTQATPAPRQITKPCSDCPWARDALNGWHGGNTIDEWLAFAHSETHIECHVHPNVQCAGAAIYRSNVGKLPRDRGLLMLPEDRAMCFASPREFTEHHETTPERKLRTLMREKRGGRPRDLMFPHPETCPCDDCKEEYDMPKTANKSQAKSKIQTQLEEVTRPIDKACGDRSWSRAEYRELLEEVETYVQASLEALDEDDRRDRELNR